MYCPQVESPGACSATRHAEQLQAARKRHELRQKEYQKAKEAAEKAKEAAEKARKGKVSEDIDPEADVLVPPVIKEEVIAGIVFSLEEHQPDPSFTFVPMASNARREIEVRAGWMKLGKVR
jgi:hypothetical protein